MKNYCCCWGFAPAQPGGGDCHLSLRRAAAVVIAPAPIVVAPAPVAVPAAIAPVAHPLALTAGAAAAGAYRHHERQDAYDEINHLQQQRIDELNQLQAQRINNFNSRHPR